MSLSRNVVCYGAEAELPEQTPLRAGPLTMTLVSGQLRHICWDNREVLRRIYVAVRDRNWRTVPPSLLDVRKHIDDDHFQIDLEMESKRDDIDFFWHVSISGLSSGTIRFAAKGIAKSAFLKNRISICVLHPIGEYAGRTCVVESTKGLRCEGIFPELISPHQVFRDVRSISHGVMPGVVAEVRFEGDTFETEDQRNWSDASYKTYCPPLDRPYPSEISSGTSLSQSVTVELRGKPEPYHPSETDQIELRLGHSSARRLPSVGLGISSADVALGKVAIQRLRALDLSHLRVDLKLSTPDYETRLRRATEEAVLVGCRVEAALFVSDAAEEELDRLRSVVERIRPPVCRWLIFHRSEKATSGKWVAMARAKLAAYQPTAKFGGGTDAYFAELSRSASPGAEFDLVSTSLNPQVHDVDNENLADNLEAQSSIVESASRFWRGLSLAVTPITLKPRFNPDATAPEPTNGPEQLPSDVDVRQMSLFGAGWTAGSLKYLSEAGAHSATYYETVGWRGVMESPLGSPLPLLFKSLPNAVFPLYHVLADFGEFARGTIVPSRSSAPQKVESLVLEKDEARRILLSNLGGESQNVRLACGESDRRFLVKVLDEHSAEWAMSSPEAFRATPGKLIEVRGQFVEIEIPPFAVVRLDRA